MTENTKNPFGSDVDAFLNDVENVPAGDLFTEEFSPDEFNPFEPQEDQTQPTEASTQEESDQQELQMPEPPIEPKTVKPAEQQPEQKAAAPEDPFAAALAKAQAASDQRTTEVFAKKPPIFSYVKVKENIEDTEKTFDDVRQQYETDFPELSEKKKVTWTVTYGKVTKPILNPESDNVYEVKKEIEKSKAFLDGIKKAKTDKEREPECLVTPRVTAQSKGEALASYKGIYPTLDDALAANKPIMYIPSRDGKVYEIRTNEIGRFTTPAASPPEISQISSGLEFHLPKIPYRILCIVLNFFKHFAKKSLEVMVHIVFNKETNDYEIRIPNQKISPTRVQVDFKNAEQNEDIIHVMDIHSHHMMAAIFSQIDDKDEKATGIYAVVGKLDSLFPQIKVRISNGGKFHEIDPGEVFELKEDKQSGSQDMEINLLVSEVLKQCEQQKTITIM